MSVHTFHNYKYSTWNIDLSYLKSILDTELNEAYNNPSNLVNAPEKIGEGTSLLPQAMAGLNCFTQVYSYIQNEVSKQLLDFNLPFYYKKKKINLIRSWANRTYKNTKGAIHNHKEHTVLVVYYDIPENSSDLVFIDPKHSDKILQEDESVPDNEKYKIKVNTGLCVLHDGRILHAVTKHGSNLHRDVLIFEFDKMF